LSKYEQLYWHAFNVLSRSRPRAWAVEPIPLRDLLAYQAHLWHGDRQEFFDVILQLDEYYLVEITKK
jgi:hypothetical protein